MAQCAFALVIAIGFLPIFVQPLDSQEQAPASAKTQATAQQQLRPARMGTEDGFAVFQSRCMSCHGNPDAKPPATSLAAIREMAPEQIYVSLIDGKMKAIGKTLTEEERLRTAEFIGSRALGSHFHADGKNMPNQCRSNPPMLDPSSAPGWSGWGGDIANTRFQPGAAAGLTADEVPRLKLKWAFGFPNAKSSDAQPAVVAGRVFIAGAENGYIYSLDAGTGCVYWSYETGVYSRNAMTVAPIEGHGATKYAVYFGDAKAYVYALDAQDGKLLWKTRTDDFFAARNTASPTYYQGRLYVPLSSSEEYRSGNPDYPCCSFRGSLAALDANTGKQIWKTYVVEEPKPTKKNSHGRQLYAPSGGSIWNSPTIDPVRHAVYVGTGDASSEPSPKTTDAILALDMDTGKILWVYQATVNDSYMGGCEPAKSEACPSEIGPDADIGNSPILRSLPGGKRVVVAATKGGDIFAIDPDNNGRLLWRMNYSGKPRSGSRFGGAADEQNAYYGFNGGGVAAVALANGERKWFAPITPTDGGVSHSAAATAIPGVVFQGGQDGALTALSTVDGHILWQYNTDRFFDTVNEVPAHGGSLLAPGAIVVRGMLFIPSGYAVFSPTKPGNVLLAFSVNGK